MTEEETRERESVALANSQELLRLMREFQLYIQAADFQNWRPTVRSAGEIPGVAQNVTIIATNGLLGYFVNDENSTVPVLCGHIQCFSGEVKTLFSTRKQKKVEVDENGVRLRRVKSQQDRAMELLRKLLPKK